MHATPVSCLSFRSAIALSIILRHSLGERYLQVAQDSFTKGAAIENQAVFDPNAAVDRNAPSLAPVTGGAVIYYIDARENVSKALSKERAALDKQQLTGSAYMLLAEVSMRLDALQGSDTRGSGSDPCETRNYHRCADTSIEAAKSLVTKEPFTVRDRFMLDILPGLLDHNLGLKKTATAPKDAGNDFESAFQNIGKGLAALEPVTPITTPAPTVEQRLKIYGLISQYQVLRAWSAAMTRASLPGVTADQALTTQQRASCKQILRTKWAPRVTSNIDTVDPRGLVVTKSVRTSFEMAIGDLNQGTQPCPWPN